MLALATGSQSNWVLMCAADLMHLLTMAHQELPSVLVELAKKDGRVRVGGGRGRGGGSRGRGGGRRQVGGAGLGFQADPVDGAPRAEQACCFAAQCFLAPTHSANRHTGVTLRPGSCRGTNLVNIRWQPHRGKDGVCCCWCARSVQHRQPGE